MIMNENETNGKMYTKKILVVYNTTIQKNLRDKYVPAIEKIGFHLPYIRIFSSTKCNQTRSGAFDSRQIIFDVKVIKCYTKN